MNLIRPYEGYHFFLNPPVSPLTEQVSPQICSVVDEFATVGGGALPPGNGGTEILEVVPTALKKQQWGVFLRHFKSFVDERNRSTSMELRLLHYIFSEGSNEGYFDAEKVRLLALLYYIDRPFGDFDQVGIINSMDPPPAGEDINPEQYRIQVVTAYQAACMGATQVHFSVNVRGRLRSYGTRDIERVDGVEHQRVYASHTCLYDSDQAELVRMMTRDPFPPPAYYGLSTGLGDVYSKLCEKYDQLKATAGNFYEKLYAEIFLQLVGTRVLHPFWDANGRSFMSHLSVTLGREGIILNQCDEAKAVTIALTNVNDEFLHALLQRNGLSLIKGINHMNMELNPRFRAHYMERLRRGIEEAIDAGVDPQGPYYDFIQRAVMKVLSHLVRVGSIDVDDDLKNLVKASLTNKVDVIRRLPEPYQGYFFSKYCELYLKSEDHAFRLTNYLVTMQKGGDEMLAAMKEAIDYYADCNPAIVLDHLSSFSYLYEMKGKDDAIKWLKAVSTTEVKDRIKGFALESMDNYFIESLWKQALEAPPTIVPEIIAAFKEESVQKLYTRYHDNGDMMRRVLTSMVEIVTHADSAIAAKYVASRLLSLPMTQVTTSLLGNLETLKSRWSILSWLARSFVRS